MEAIMFKFEFKKNSRRRSARNFEIGQVHSMGKTILSKILPPQPPPPSREDYHLAHFG